MARVENGPGTMVLGAADRARAVAAIKARLRVASDDEDALIAAFAESALGLAEQVTGQALIARPMAQRIVANGAWQRLAVQPVRTIASVVDATGVALPLDAHTVDIAGDGAGWVRIAPTGTAARIDFVAGLAGDWDTLPAPVRDGATMLAAHLFDDRTGAAPIPAAVTALWRPFRVLRLAPERRA